MPATAAPRRRRMPRRRGRRHGRSAALSRLLQRLHVVPGAPYAPLTDAAWSALEATLPVRSPQGRPTRLSPRQIVEALRWKFATGQAWRDMPAECQPWETLYTQFRRLLAHRWR